MHHFKESYEVMWVPICESCGMPMEKPSDFGGSDTKNKYCTHCTTSDGTLKSRTEVRDGMINFYINTMKKSRKEAEKFVDESMSKMPAWKK